MASHFSLRQALPMLLALTVVLASTAPVERETALLTQPHVVGPATASVAPVQIVCALVTVLLALVHLATDRVLLSALVLAGLVTIARDHTLLLVLVALFTFLHAVFLPTQLQLSLSFVCAMLLSPTCKKPFLETFQAALALPLLIPVPALD